MNEGVPWLQFYGVGVVRKEAEAGLIIKHEVLDIFDGYFVGADFDYHAVILHGDGFLSTGLLVDSHARLPLR